MSTNFASNFRPGLASRIASRSGVCGRPRIWQAKDATAIFVTLVWANEAKNQLKISESKKTIINNLAFEQEYLTSSTVA
jgi:hypothetical protein